MLNWNFIINCAAGAIMAWYTIHWRNRARKAEIKVKFLEATFESTLVIGAMLRGIRPLVEKAPDGLSLTEAQMLVDNIYESVKG